MVENENYKRRRHACAQTNAHIFYVIHVECKSFFFFRSAVGLLFFAAFMRLEKFIPFVLSFRVSDQDL